MGEREELKVGLDQTGHYLKHGSPICVPENHLNVIEPDSASYTFGNWAKEFMVGILEAEMDFLARPNNVTGRWVENPSYGSKRERPHGRVPS